MQSLSGDDPSLARTLTQPAVPSTVNMAAGQMVPSPPKSAAIEQVDKIRATVRGITDRLRDAEYRLQL